MIRLIRRSINQFAFSLKRFELLVKLKSLKHQKVDLQFPSNTDFQKLIATLIIIKPTHKNTKTALGKILQTSFVIRSWNFQVLIKQLKRQNDNFLHFSWNFSIILKGNAIITYYKNTQKKQICKGANSLFYYRFWEKLTIYTSFSTLNSNITDIYQILIFISWVWK